MKEIALTQGKIALIDDDDFERVSQHKWCAQKTKVEGLVYARSSLTLAYLHRFIVREPDGIVDHKDGNGLNCQKNNLRICDYNRNAWHRNRNRGNTGFKGVEQAKKGEWVGNWRAKVGTKYLGTFRTATEAAEAYDREATQQFGEFALTNQKLGLLPS